MNTERFDNLVRFYHQEGWGWREAVHRAEELLGGVEQWPKQ